MVLKSMRIGIYATMTLGQGVLIGLYFLLHGMPNASDWWICAHDLLPLALPLLPGIIVLVRVCLLTCTHATYPSGTTQPTPA